MDYSLRIKQGANLIKEANRIRLAAVLFRENAGEVLAEIIVAIKRQGRTQCY